ncbi:hypothetical protein DW322_03640 [Rhodococcus rhodnii]|uniref:Uncharacterized protein n=2 Tax=Rhodococcus rhodnii TaxID=38312 RepID=R7WMS4_9NOCA|nr:hypothetical protein Rrhod_1995 [Rhodococcus rhodnii LMG 5362]TXG89482.1 hypothetical protein DW322_03640 [Rhodococcus rhodnii]
MPAPPGTGFGGVAKGVWTTTDLWMIGLFVGTARAPMSHGATTLGAMRRGEWAIDLQAVYDASQDGVIRAGTLEQLQIPRS